jgi:hypothetical protein
MLSPPGIPVFHTRIHERLHIYGHNSPLYKAGHRSVTTGHDIINRWSVISIEVLKVVEVFVSAARTLILFEALQINQAHRHPI